MGRSLRRGSSGSGSADRSAARAQDANAEVSRATIERNGYKLPYPIRDVKEDGEQLGWEFKGNADTATDADHIGGVPAEDVVPDGLPPSSSPSCTLLSGIGFLMAKWDAITNHDPVTYDVHISTTTGFTPDGTTYLASTDGTMLAIRTTAAGTDLVQGTLYYVKIIARDVDGSASAGAQGSAITGLVTSDDIAADAVLANHILAGEITADKLEAILVLATAIKTATSGQRVEIDTDGIFLYDSGGNPLVGIPTNPSDDPTFLGTLKATELQLNAGDGPWGSSATRTEWVSSGGDVAGVLAVDDNGDGSFAIGNLASVHPDEAAMYLQAVNDEVSPTYTAGVNVRVEPAAAAGYKTLISLFGTGIGGLKVLDDLGDSDFATDLGYFDDGSAAASSSHTEVVQLPLDSIWLLSAYSEGPNEVLSYAALIHVPNTTAINVGIFPMGTFDYSLGSMSFTTQNGAGQWTFNASSSGIVNINFVHGASGAATWHWKAMRVGNKGRY